MKTKTLNYVFMAKMLNFLVYFAVRTIKPSGTGLQLLPHDNEQKEWK